ncbi:MAG: type II toxin-antitoxin system Phd/YefM family antitoxin [Egibacteraceae bacterium]
MAITASELRRNVYRLLDEVLETGVPLEIERGGHRLRIVPSERSSRFDRPGGNPDAIVGDPDELVHLDWSTSWTPRV